MEGAPSNHWPGLAGALLRLGHTRCKSVAPLHISQHSIRFLPHHIFAAAILYTFYLHLTLHVYWNLAWYASMMA